VIARAWRDQRGYQREAAFDFPRRLKHTEDRHHNKPQDQKSQTTHLLKWIKTFLENIKRVCTYNISYDESDEPSGIFNIDNLEEPRPPVLQWALSLLFLSHGFTKLKLKKASIKL
jgi:hypothetical protein